MIPQEIKSKPNYFQDPDYTFFPVVGISYEQAIEYCNWRSKKVTELYNNRPKVKKANKKYKITYRLPSESEWVRIACNGYTIDTLIRPYGYGNINVKIKLNKDWGKFYEMNGVSDELKLPDAIEKFNINNNIILNFNYHNSNKLFQFNTPFHCYSFYPTASGLYNIIGNVAEMTNKKGIAKGGSWKQSKEECKINSVTHYSSPNDYIGFRCVSDIEEL